MKVTIKDTNNTKELLRTLKEIGKAQINVGILGDDSEIAMIATVHEFGCNIQVTDKMRGWFGANGYPLKKETTVIRIPERSFLRSGYDENIDKIVGKVEEMLPSVLENDVNPKVFMDAIGLEFAGLIQKKLRDLKSPANSDMTVERKGSSNPLVDTGRLVGAIQHEVK
ncbi:hypothetical protein ACFQ38_16210 [Sporosarcina contaminans]|uniref:Uncharacterized protein n=1 Tax=Sporosarcina contaminans TaxID=633403 RepID=A0ABW3U0T1_9BACL